MFTCSHVHPYISIEAYLYILAYEYIEYKSTHTCMSVERSVRENKIYYEEVHRGLSQLRPHIVIFAVSVHLYRLLPLEIPCAATCAY